MGNDRIHWSPARIAASSLALIPVALFVLAIGGLLWSSVPALTQVGLPRIFSNDYSTIADGTYNPTAVGLLPAIWGTVLLALLVLCMATPAALSLALFASEFSIAGLGRLVELALSLFAGIPPVIYGVFAFFIGQTFFVPKFAGEYLTEQEIRALPGMPPLNAATLPGITSTLMGGVLLTLLVIPFMAPLMLDAIRSVQPGLKEASMGLGANRWHTLRRVMLPAALPGLVTAVSLGLLKTIGDVVIAVMAVGWGANHLPVPLWDVFQKTAPLSGAAAGLMGGMVAASDSTVVTEFSRTSVADFAALMLLLMAFGIMFLAAILQRSLLRRYAQ